MEMEKGKEEGKREREEGKGGVQVQARSVCMEMHRK